MMQPDSAYKPRKRLRTQFITMLLAWLVLPVLVVFAFLVNQTVKQDKENNLQVLTKTAEQIVSDFANMSYTLYNISDYFANDEALLEMVRADYSNNIALKHVNMAAMKNRFVEADTFNSTLMIDAIYTREGDVFNFYQMDRLRGSQFYDPLPMTAIDRLRAMAIDAPEKLARLIWYPLQDNFFQAEPTGDLRQDLILLGSRRTYHRYLGYYLKTHLFVIPEQTLYNRYSSYIIGDGITVYLLNTDHDLLSCSDESILREGVVDSSLLDIIDNAMATGNREVRVDDTSLLAAYATQEKSEWIALVTMPTEAAIQSVVMLFMQMLGAVVIISLLFIIVLTLFSRRISRPLTAMIDSMQHVEHGDFMPAPVPDTRNEIEQLTLYYNQMVERLQALIEDRYERDKRSKALEAKVLMGQINPHFMYNTLESIVWKAHEAKRPDIARIASQLGHLLRHSVKDDAPFILLSQEVSQTLLYVEIQKARYKERLQVEILPYDDQLDTLRVLRFVLQPSIENAIVHGMHSDDRALLVRVSVRQDGDMLTITIEDDGLGMSAERLAQVQAYVEAEEVQDTSSGAGIGIRNVHQRLLLYFGNAYGITIESTPGAGTKVTVRMPADIPEGGFGARA